MQYMLLIYSGDAPERWESLREDEQNAIMGEYMARSPIAKHEARITSRR